MFIIWVSTLPAFFFEYYAYWQGLYVNLGSAFPWARALFWILFPFDALFVFYLTVLAAIAVSRFFLFWVNLFHRPREGVFTRDPPSKDFKYWGLRNIVRKWPFFLLASTPFPWLRGRFVLRAFGVKVGKRCSLLDGFVTPEFVELGDGVVLGQSAVITSHAFEGDKLIIRKVKVGSNVIVGSRVTILPGTVVGDGVTISGESWTMYHQRLEPRGVYRGKPAKRLGAVPDGGGSGPNR